MAQNQHQRALLRASLSGMFLLAASSLGVCQSLRADQKIKRAGLQIKTLRTSIPIACNSRLGGVAVGPEGNIYISNFISAVWRVKPGGETDLLASNLQGSSGNAVLHGDLLQSSFNDNRILRIDLNGAQSVFASAGLNGPIGIATSADGKSLIMNNIKGTWKSKQAAELVLRQIDLQPFAMEPKVELEKGQLKLGELTFDYLAAGPLDGEAVLLLHGFPQTGYSYRAQLSALARQGYRAVAPDQRGYSAGARPLSIDQYGISHLVADALGMAGALGFENFHLVGHDWGAAVAWSLAARHPERLNSLTILSTPHYAAFSAQLRDPDSDQSHRSAYMADFAAAGAETRMLANDAAGLRAIYGSAAFSEQDIQVYLDALGSEAALGSALNWYRAMGSSGPKTGGAPPVRPSSKIEVPTLYLFGLQDSAFALNCAQSSSDYVSADYRFVPLEGMGHWLLEEASQEVNRELLQHLAQNGERE